MRTNSNVAFNCKFHIVFCPKYRRGVLVDSVDARLKQIVAEVCDEYDAIVIDSEVMPDHIYLLVDVDPQFVRPTRCWDDRL